MKTDAINSWQELASIVERFHEGTWIFRGVENAQYELIPRVGRPNTSYDLRTSTPLDYSPKFEALCIEQFKREAKPHMDVQPHGSEGLVKWVLPGTICFTLKVILNKCGINEASMFPDLGGIARHVRWLLKWPQLLSGGS